MNYLRPERLDALARAYALGTLSPRAARRFARIVAGSAVAAQAVSEWQELLGALEQGAPASPAPRPRVWAAVQRRLFERDERARPRQVGAGRGARTARRGRIGCRLVALAVDGPGRRRAAAVDAARAASADLRNGAAVGRRTGELRRRAAGSARPRVAGHHGTPARARTHRAAASPGRSRARPGLDDLGLERQRHRSPAPGRQLDGRARRPESPCPRKPKRCWAP